MCLLARARTYGLHKHGLGQKESKTGGLLMAAGITAGETGLGHENRGEMLHVGAQRQSLCTSFGALCEDGVIICLWGAQNEPCLAGFQAQQCRQSCGFQPL